MELKKYTWQELNEMRVSKGELFAELRSDKTHEFDYALPQDWLDALAAFCEQYAPLVTYDLIRSTTVWVYPESAPLTVCTDVDKAIDLYCIAILNKWAGVK